MRPVAVGVGAVPAPTGPIVGAFPSPNGPIVAVSPSAAPKPVAAPVSLTIPLIGVQTNLLTLGLASDGTLQVPPPNMVSVAGWYTGSPRPGAIGSSIIVGHIDGETLLLQPLSQRAGQRLVVLDQQQSHCLLRLPFRVGQRVESEVRGREWGAAKLTTRGPSRQILTGPILKPHENRPAVPLLAGKQWHGR